MLETHEFKGYWWLPGAEEDKLSGDLRIERGRARLDVLGSFGQTLLSETPREKTYSLDPSDQDRVLGISSGGKRITLERLSSGDTAISIPGLRTASYHAEVAIVGEHFAHGRRVAFDEIAIELTDLNEWTGVSGFELSTEFERLDPGGSMGFASLAARYEAPEPIQIPIYRGEEMSIRFAAVTNGLRGETDHLDIRQKAALHLYFKRKAGLEKILERVAQIRNFLTLAVGRPVSVLAGAGFLEPAVSGRARAARPIQIYRELVHNPEPPPGRRRAGEMFFSLAQARPEITTVIRRWLGRQRRLEPVFNLFFGSIYHPSLYLEVRFLAFAQALETYESRRRRSTSKRSLREKMRALLGDSKTVTRQIVGPEVEDFLDLLMDTRNYYTHYNPRLEARAASGTGLLLLTLQLRATIEAAMLRELGFGGLEIDEILERTRRYEEISHFRAMLGEES
jgi:hypothetical protein